MPTVRYVIMVPREVEADVIGDEKMITEWGNQIAESYDEVHSMHPRQKTPYPAKVLEAVVVDEPEESVMLDDMIAPGLVA